MKGLELGNLNYRHLRMSKEITILLGFGLPPVLF